ncbi:hypothetical protein GBN24_09810 [Plesiomonas shigelloides]|uniref:hypothetical protein n=1 Tax=Plesiomonas shigelloides TaxID=703 RepID=UPI0012617E92|nr:hypothetical protein [Plesiomonas shigelloides]KAB7689951.1 hypothetical protein GBN24_09810 [Plesiomonas shigelloides]
MSDVYQAQTIDLNLNIKLILSALRIAWWRMSNNADLLLICINADIHIVTRIQIIADINKTNFNKSLLGIASTFLTAAVSRRGGLFWRSIASALFFISKLEL